ncbi:MAG: GNAT family N-acetyltransferase [Ilumatobacteraceae bacterium]
MSEEAVIRAERDGDHEAIRRVVGAAFDSQVEADLVEAIRSSPEYVAEMALVAEVDGEIVGHVMISGATLRTDGGDRPIVMLSPLAVHPDHQRRGVGGTLVRAATALAARAGEPLVTVEGDPRYYSQFGFEFSRPLGIEFTLPDWAPVKAGQILRLAGYDTTLRGAVIYPPAFDDLE